MSIELRSKSGIEAATAALQSGDYDAEITLQLKFHSPLYTDTASREIEEALQLMMERAGKLPNLLTLEISPIINQSDHNFCIPIKALKNIFDYGENLEILVLQNIKLIGERNEFQAAAECLKGHSCLKSVTYIGGCQGREWNDDADTYDITPIDDTAESPIDLVVAALGSIDSLERVDLRRDGTFGGERLQKETIQQLGRLPNLTILYVLDCCLPDDLVVTLTQSLAVTELTEFRLSCGCLGKDGSKALQHFFKNNKTIKACQLNFVDFQEESDPNFHLGEILRAIAQSGVTSLYLNIAETHLPALLEKTREMLRDNYKLYITGIYSMDIDTDNGMVISSVETVQDKEIDFLLKANKLGRGRLFQNKGGYEDDKGEISWMSLFEQATEFDLDNIFYLVRSHPFEFAEMGLNDCSENMIPTRRIMKTMFVENDQRVTKRMKRELCDPIMETINEQKATQEATMDRISQLESKHQAVVKTIDTKQQAMVKTVGEINKTQQAMMKAVGKINKTIAKNNKKEQALERKLLWYKGALLALSTFIAIVLATFKLDD